MSFLPSKKTPSQCEAQCPDCGVTLSRLADMNRHRRNRHPDGTEVKFACPWSGCAFKATQKGNLKSHYNARHSNVPKFSCQECPRRFTDPAARIRHRKKKHGYVPYHTAEYVARQAQDSNERVVQGPSNVVSSESLGQQVARAPSVASEGALGASSSVSPAVLNSHGTPYHNDFWNMPVDIMHSFPFQSSSSSSQGVTLSVPSETLPGYDTPHAIQPFPPAARSQSLVNSEGAIAPSDFTRHYYSQFQCDPRIGLDDVEATMHFQGEESGRYLTGDHGVPFNENVYNWNVLWNWPHQ